MRFEQKINKAVHFKTVKEGEVFAFPKNIDVPFLKVKSGMVHSHRSNTVYEGVQAVCLLTGYALKDPIEDCDPVCLIKGKFVEE